MILYKTSTYSHHEEIKHMIKDSGVDDAVVRKPKTEDKYNMNKQVQLFQQFHF